VEFRVAQCVFVRGLRLAQGIADRDRPRTRPRLVPVNGRAALLEERGLANSGIAVTP
jgi:hypothetical protein